MTKVKYIERCDQMETVLALVDARLAELRAAVDGDRHAALVCACQLNEEATRLAALIARFSSEILAEVPEFPL